MFGFTELAKIVFSFLNRTADAKRNLTSYLETYLRPAIFEKINTGNILAAIANKVGEGTDKKLFLEDLVDNLIEDKKGEDIRALVTSKARRKLGLDRDLAFKIVGTKKFLNNVEEDYLKQIQKEFVPLISKYLLNYFNSEYKVWVRKHEKEPRLTEDMPEPSVPPEHEIEEEIREKHEWEEGLIKDVIDLINKKSPDARKKYHKIILKDMFLSKNPKTIPQLAKELNLSTGAVHKYKTELGRMLASFLTAQGLGGSFLEEGGLVKKEIEIPKYTEHLKNKKNSDDFLEFAENKFGSIGDLTKQIIPLLAQGKNVAQIESEGFKKYDIDNVKKRYFLPWYKEWYKEKVEEVRKSAAQYFIKEAHMKLQAKRVTIPYEKKDEGDDSAATAAAHEKMVDQAIDKHEIIATIFFSANYDNLDVVGGRKDPEKDPVNFEYKEYEASLYKERSFGKNKRSIDYKYTQKLTDEGEFEGSGKSTLKLDGAPVSANNDLKKELDNYVEHHMKPEGMLPYGRAVTKKTKNILFPVSYENVKINKKYNGVRQFFEKYRGLLVEDPAHAKRKKFVKEKEIRKQLPAGERERIKEKIFDLKDELDDLKDEKPRNTKRIKELEGHIKELEDFIKGKGDEDLKEIEDIIEMEMKLLDPKEPEEKTAFIKLVYAATLPPPQMDSVKKLIKILGDYNVSKPKPTGWLVPVDILTLAKQLKARVKIDLQKRLKELKGKKLDKEQKAHELESAAREAINEATKGFTDLPVDLRKRRDMFMKSHPKDYQQFAINKDIGWVDSEPQIDRIKGKIFKEMREEITELKKIKAPKKQPAVRVLEKGKFKALEAFLEQGLDGLDVIAKRFSKAALGEESMNPELTASVNSEISNSEKELSKLESKLKEISSDENDKAQIKKYLDNVKALKKNISDMKKTLEQSTDIPALTMAEILKDKISYFSGLYSILSSILFFGESTYIQAEEENISEEDKADLTKIRRKIVETIGVISKKPIHAKDAIKSGLSNVRSLINKFIDEYRFLGYSLRKTPRSPAPRQSYDEINLGKPFPYLTAADETFEEARVKMIFPADELSKAKKMVESIKKDKNKDISIKGDAAQKELNEIIKNVSQAYGEGFSKDRIKALAEKENISFDKASTRLKRIKDSLARSALSEFILKWQDVKQDIRRIERTPLSNRPASDYEYMSNFVERQLPDLFKLAPPEELPEEPKRGVPTPKKIREKIEDQFTAKKPAEMEEKYDFFTDPSGTSGGGGGKAKGRKKPVKPPVPSGALETLKDDFVKMFKRYDAQRLVLTILAQYAKRLRGVIKNLKEDEYLDVDDVIDGFVSLLKSLQFLISTLNVSPSQTAWRLPPKGAPRFTGKPDIEINTFKEAKEVFDKIINIYKTINKYIAPDTVGIPPKDISKLRKPKKYLPSGLMDWYEYLREQDKKKKEAQEYPMAYRLAQKFVGTDIHLADCIDETYLIMT